ncbi:meiosis-specific nuclear structural protein 1 [Meleagris gallopavo]|nr:meiosis-specific nuclear structural protein 1 [Meleagris gallopavo]
MASSCSNATGTRGIGNREAAEVQRSGFWGSRERRALREASRPGRGVAPPPRRRLLREAARAACALTACFSERCLQTPPGAGGWAAARSTRGREVRGRCRPPPFYSRAGCRVASPSPRKPAVPAHPPSSPPLWAETRLSFLSPAVRSPWQASPGAAGFRAAATFRILMPSGESEAIGHTSPRAHRVEALCQSPQPEGAGGRSPAQRPQCVTGLPAIGAREKGRGLSLELRELEKKLKSAYLNKERAAQVAEKEAIEFEKMKREAEIAQKMKEEYERAAKEESLAELRRNEEKITYQQELEKQLEEQERKKQGVYDEFLKEKLMIDEIVRKIYEEDQKEKQLKLEKMRATQTYIEEFKKEQAVWRQRKREEMEEENRKIVEFANSQREREEDWMAKVRDMEEKKQRLQAMIAQNLEREQQKRDELERIRQELYLEEQLETDRKKEMAEIEKRIRQRLDLRQMYEEQFALKKIAQRAVQEEEEAFRQQMQAKFAEDDRIEQMNAQKRRMKQLEHRKAVEKLIEDRHKQFIADKERELEEWQLEEKRQANIRAVVEEERQKLLKEHASKLLGYLPRGILKGEDDINMLGEEFRLAYQKRRGNPSSEES